MNTRNRLIFLLIIILIPQTILANAGTALMWMPVFQLMFGNILIGLIEGLVVSLFYKTKWYRSILIMIAGNYTSWLIGNGIIYLFQEYFITSVFQLKGVFIAWIASMIILYILTVIIELQFFNWIFKKNNKKWKRSLKLSLILNIVTYSLMIFLYVNAGKYNVFTDLKINQSLLDKEFNYDLFVKRDNKILKGKITNKFNGELVYKIPEQATSLYFYLNEDTINQSVDLLLGYYDRNFISVIKDFIPNHELVHYPRLFRKNRLPKFDYRDTLVNDWDAWNGSWAIEGLTIKNSDNIRENFAFEVPWMFWQISQVSILNDKELIFTFNGRLILLNRETKEMAFITKLDNYIIRKEL